MVHDMLICFTAVDVILVLQNMLLSERRQMMIKASEAMQIITEELKECEPGRAAQFVLTYVKDVDNWRCCLFLNGSTYIGKGTVPGEAVEKLFTHAGIDY